MNQTKPALVPISTLVSQEQLTFLQKVINSQGSKLSNHSYSSDGTTPLWEDLEKLGIISAIGSYKWEPTDRIILCIEPPAPDETPNTQRDHPDECWCDPDTPGYNPSCPTHSDHSKYYLLDNKNFAGNDLLFWRKGGQGYTTNIDEAERFTKDQLTPHLNSGKYRAWKLSDLEPKARRTVDVQRLNFHEALTEDSPT